MATPEENLAAALAKADAARSEGKQDRVAIWEASADRYRRIIESKAKIAQASKNIEAIRIKLNEALGYAADSSATADKAAADAQAADAAKSLADGIANAERYAAAAVAAKAMADAASAAAATTAVTTTKTSYNLVSSLRTPDPTPITPNTSVTVKAPPPPPVKTAPIDTVLFNDDSMSIEMMADLIFEDIGGHELINIARNDIINGQQVSYTPIKNLGLIQQTYNPNNILRLQSTSEKYFANFSIKLEEKVPLVGNGPNGSNVYIDQTTGDLIIEGININKDELFEVELSLNGTIYEANFGATTS